MAVDQTDEPVDISAYFKTIFASEESVNQVQNIYICIIFSSLSYLINIKQIFISKKDTFIERGFKCIRYSTEYSYTVSFYDSEYWIWA